MYYAVMIHKTNKPHEGDTREFENFFTMKNFWDKCVDAGDAEIVPLSKVEVELGLKSRMKVKEFTITQVVATHWEQ